MEVQPAMMGLLFMAIWLVSLVLLTAALYLTGSNTETTAKSTGLSRRRSLAPNSMLKKRKSGLDYIRAKEPGNKSERIG